MDVESLDGREATARVARGDVDLWIPDDAAWAGSLPEDLFAPKSTVGSGSTVATSPIYMVTDASTAARINSQGGSWRALADLLVTNSGVRLAVRDPGSSGDGMLGAGAVAEAVWIDDGMDASALALANFKRVTRTVTGNEPAMPERPGEVGLIPEYALVPRMDSIGRDMAVLPGRDLAALLRYTWFPTAAGIRDPGRADALGRLLDAVTGPDGAVALASAGLRGPDAGAPPPNGNGRVPALAGAAFEVLGPHHVDHVFATWYAPDRRTNLLVVVDVSGSMNEPAPGTRTPLIELVRRGCRAVAELLPESSRYGLWEFGARLDGNRDYRVLVPPAPLSDQHRATLGDQVGKLTARRTGTGLYDTIHAAYMAGRDGYLQGMPNHVLVFTDGRNEFDPGSISLARLTTSLKQLQDPNRPVQLSVVVFGVPDEAERLEKALEPVDGYVDDAATAQDVAAAFIHQAAGGLHAH
jgi:hypothetical protein